MLSLQERGCHNINFVTPTHVVPQILAAISLATRDGLKVPLIYNCSGYESIETLKLLDGIIDIYMPDFKFWNATSASRYAKAPDYPEHARAALKEMHRQVGDLILNDKGIARSGLLVRHLVMPGGLEETENIIHFIAQHISRETYVNIMDQYHPCGHAVDYPPLDRPLSAREYRQALEIARQGGLTRLDKRNVSDLLHCLFASKNQ
jgi:putative pyruvate formate lyase activating enzyme